MINTNVQRWIKASVYNHFNNFKGNIPLYFDSYSGDQSWAELRLAGPVLEEFTLSDNKISYDISILLTAFIAGDDYVLERMIGIFTEAFTDICCYRYGDGPDDDQTLFGALQVPSGNLIETTNFGFIEPGSKFKRSMIEATYVMYLVE